MIDKVRLQLFTRGESHPQNDERLDDIPFQRIGLSDNRRFGNGLVGDEGTLHLGSADIVACHDDDVIGSADDHDIPVLSLDR